MRSKLVLIIGVVVLATTLFYLLQGPGNVIQTETEVTALGPAPLIGSGAQTPDSLLPEEREAVRAFRDRIVNRVGSGTPLTQEEKSTIVTLLITSQLYQFTPEERATIDRALK